MPGDVLYVDSEQILHGTQNNSSVHKTANFLFEFLKIFAQIKTSCAGGKHLKISIAYVLTVHTC